MYVPSHGGAEISMYSLLKQLKKKFGWEIISITDSRYEKTKNNSLFNEIEIKTVQHSKRIKEIEKNILNFKPDVIITQLMWSDIALKLAKKHKIPSIMRVCKVPLELNLNEDSEYLPTAIIGTSKHIKNYVKKKWNREAIIINPLVEFQGIFKYLNKAYKPPSKIKNSIIHNRYFIGISNSSCPLLSINKKARTG